MTVVSPESLVQQLQWRYAVKKFDPQRTISAEIWAALEAALVLTPSSFGLQPWRFDVITNPSIKAQLPALSWGQSQVADGSHVVVFSIRSPLTEADVDRYLARVTEVRGTPAAALSGFRGIMLQTIEKVSAAGHLDDWSARQVYIALGNFMTAAALLHVDTCPMEGIEAEQYDQLLKLPSEGFKTVVVCVAGYRTMDDKYAAAPKVRFPHADVIRHR